MVAVENVSIQNDPFQSGSFVGGWGWCEDVAILALHLLLNSGQEAKGDVCAIFVKTHFSNSPLLTLQTSFGSSSTKQPHRKRVGKAAGGGSKLVEKASRTRLANDDPQNLVVVVHQSEAAPAVDPLQEEARRTAAHCFHQSPIFGYKNRLCGKVDMDLDTRLVVRYSEEDRRADLEELRHRLKEVTDVCKHVYLGCEAAREDVITMIEAANYEFIMSK